MKPMSKKGKEMIAFQKELADEFGYEPIEPNFLLGDVRQKYKDALPQWCNVAGDLTCPLSTLDGTLLCQGYNRIVIGDYGAFVEIAPDLICKEVLRCKPGQEFRYMDERFAENVKYIWLTAKDRSGCKIYLQKKKVSYADYVPGMYYISVYEVENA